MSRLAAASGPVVPDPAVSVRLGDWALMQAYAAPIRRAVFIVEQQIPEPLEWDEHDGSSLHAVAFLGEAPVGTARLLPDAHIGRMAVLPAHRRRQVASRLLQALMTEAARRGHDQVQLSAQTYARALYAAHGFEAFGPVYDDAGIAHQMMRRALV